MIGKGTNLAQQDINKLCPFCLFLFSVSAAFPPSQVTDVITTYRIHMVLQFDPASRGETRAYTYCQASPQHYSNSFGLDQ